MTVFFFKKKQYFFLFLFFFFLLKFINNAKERQINWLVEEYSLGVWRNFVLSMLKSKLVYNLLLRGHFPLQPFYYLQMPEFPYFSVLKNINQQTECFMIFNRICPRCWVRIELTNMTSKLLHHARWPKNLVIVADNTAFIIRLYLQIAKNSTIVARSTLRIQLWPHNGSERVKSYFSTNTPTHRDLVELLRIFNWL